MSFYLLNFIRAMGEKCLSGHMEEQKETLTELISRIHLNTTVESEESNPRRNRVRDRVVGAVGAVGGVLFKSMGAPFGDLAASALPETLTGVFLSFY